jgi:hypothetical protein
VNASRIYLFRKNMVRLGWGSYAFKQARMGMSTPETDLRRRFSEQLNAHSELLNATMRHLGTELVAFTLGSHLEFIHFHACVVCAVPCPPLAAAWSAFALPPQRAHRTRAS